MGWQSGVRLCIMPGLPTHLVQELNGGTVVIEGVLAPWISHIGLALTLSAYSL